MVQINKDVRRRWLQRGGIGLVLLGVAGWLAHDWLIPAPVPKETSVDLSAGGSAPLAPAPVASSDGAPAPTGTATGETGSANRERHVGRVDPARTLARLVQDDPAGLGPASMPDASNDPGVNPAAQPDTGERSAPGVATPLGTTASLTADACARATNPQQAVLMPPPLALLVAACTLQQRLLQPQQLAAAADPGRP